MAIKASVKFPLVSLGVAAVALGASDLAEAGSIEHLEPTTAQGNGDTYAFGITADGRHAVGYSQYSPALGCFSTEGDSAMRWVRGPWPWSTSYAPSTIPGSGSQVCSSAFAVTKWGAPFAKLQSVYEVGESEAVRDVACNSALAAYWLDDNPAIAISCSVESPCGSDADFYPIVAIDVSLDGSVIIGWGSVGNCGRFAFRWTQGGGLDLLPGSGTFLDDATVSAIDDSGTRIVGGIDASVTYTPGDTPPIFGTAAVWDGNVRTLIGPQFSFATDVSRDGSTVVGSYFDLQANAARAFSWTDTGGFVDLGTPSNNPNPGWIYATASNHDGSIITGFYSQGGSGNERPFIWDTKNGMRDLEDLATIQGIDLADWDIQWPTGLSADGMTILGNGEFTDVNSNVFDRAWVITLDSLDPCAVDVDGDGRIDVEDLYAWYQNPIDINGDGLINSADSRCLEFAIRTIDGE